jgi:DNA-directed RNA polymerase subunit beta'
VRGITWLGRNATSFLSAASFEKTDHVLIDAALADAVDLLDGLKENVLMGRLMPAGTGFLAHREAKVRAGDPT